MPVAPSISTSSLQWRETARGATARDPHGFVASMVGPLVSFDGYVWSVFPPRRRPGVRRSLCATGRAETAEQARAAAEVAIAAARS